MRVKKLAGAICTAMVTLALGTSAMAQTAQRKPYILVIMGKTACACDQATDQ